MPDLVKIGQTANDPSLRASELCTTGVPGPFKLEYKGRFFDYAALEVRVHRALSQSRHTASREFFRVSVEDAICMIRNLSASSAIEEQVLYLSPSELAAAAIRLKKERRLAAETAERERKEEGKIIAWLAAANSLMEKKRQSYVREKTRVEAGKVWPNVEPIIWVGIFGVGIATFPIGLIVAGGLFLLDRKEKRERLRRLESEAILKHPDKTFSDVERLKATGEWKPLATSTLRCPKCNQRLNAPAGKHLALRCPSCTHEWVQMT